MNKKTPELLAKAKELRDSGLSYQTIGDALGVSNNTIRRWLNPEYAEKQRAACREYHHKVYSDPKKRASENKRKRESARKRRVSEPDSVRKKDNEYKRKQRQNNTPYAERQRAACRRYVKQWCEENRFKRSLSQSKREAIKHSREPCNATVQELEQAFHGSCDICGVSESELTRRLSVDHCHGSGTFRGHLCGDCNLGLGKLRDNPWAAFRYLDPERAQLIFSLFIASQQPKRRRVRVRHKPRKENTTCTK